MRFVLCLAQQGKLDVNFLAALNNSIARSVDEGGEGLAGDPWKYGLDYPGSGSHKRRDVSSVQVWGRCPQIPAVVDVFTGNIQVWLGESCPKAVIAMPTLAYRRGCSGVMLYHTIFLVGLSGCSGS